MENPSRDSLAVLDRQGRLIRDGALSPDGYAVNTVFPSFPPHSLQGQRHALILTPQAAPTIGDRLSDKGVDWAWYAGGWNDAMAGRPDPSFQFHHQPYTYFRLYADNTPARRAHLRDEADFLEAIEQGRLPAVSFYKPLGRLNEHPGYADVLSSERHIAGILEKIEKSPQWPSTVAIVTYDEFGGFWDHVPPPKGDRWGPGQRVPAIIVSPFSRGGHVDHHVYDTTSILRLIEERFGLSPLGRRDAAVTSLSRALALPQ